MLGTWVNAIGYPEILGLDVTAPRDRPGRLAFLRGRQGLHGVQLVTSGLRSQACL